MKIIQPRVLILERRQNPWQRFLREFFDDTSAIISTFYDAATGGSFLDKNPQDVIFVNAGLLTPPLIQKLKFLRQSLADCRIFQLGFREKMETAFPFDASFDLFPSVALFQRHLTQHLPLPDPIRVLVMEDEDEISVMVREYLGERTNPKFQVRCVENGSKGLEALDENIPDVILLDIKMPVRDGREVYREIVNRDLKVPVIIYFDAVSGDEIAQIREIGRPAILEKGSGQSAMSDLTALIKKKVFFG